MDKNDRKDEIESIVERMKYLLETGHESDVAFLVGNEGTGKELIKAHKFVLGKICSSVFDAHFRANEANGLAANKPIEVIDVEPSAFKAMLKFLYTDNLSGINKGNITAVLATAKKYLQPGFAVKCVELAVELLDVENALGLLKVADLHDVKDVADYCWAFVDQHIENIVAMDEFLMLSQKEVKELFERDTLLCNELKLFQGLDRWAHKQCLKQNIENPTGEQKRAAMGSALNAIRFPLINLADFINKIVSSGILTDKEMLSIVLHNLENINAQQISTTTIPMPFSTEQRAKNKWNLQDCSPSLSFSGNGIILTYSGPNNGVNSVRAFLPIPIFNLKYKMPYMAIVFYFEVKVVNNSNCNIGIGFCDREFPLQGKLLGKFKNSAALWRKKQMWIGESLIELKNATEGTYNEGEVIGIGLLYFPNNSLKCFATSNGLFIGLTDLPSKYVGMKLFPAVTLCSEGDSIEANFCAEKWHYDPLQQLSLEDCWKGCRINFIQKLLHRT